ncbi:MAG TPA: hypothetical protein VK970_03260, partial [Candidatus Methylacidiphilales bacterium]|nr:hypothetical protein [Candidatus Methylacidiphilales bacterium]
YTFTYWVNLGFQNGSPWAASLMMAAGVATLFVVANVYERNFGPAAMKARAAAYRQQQPKFSTAVS